MFTQSDSDTTEFFQIIDATEDCKTIAKAVRDLCSGKNRFTITHIVDVLKGSSSQKVISSKHNESPYNGHLNDWNLYDVKRLLHRMIIDKHLQEEFIFFGDIPHAYLKIGNIETLMKGGVKIEFAISTEKYSKANIRSTLDATVYDGNTLNDNMNLSDIEDQCHNDLINLCSQLAKENDCDIGDIANIRSLKSMSIQLPITKEEMLSLPLATTANFDKFGKLLLETTCTYAAKKLGEFFTFESIFTVD